MATADILYTVSLYFQNFKGNVLPDISVPSKVQQQITQQQKISQTLSKEGTDFSLFKLLLSMAHTDISQVAHVQSSEPNNMLTSQHVEPNYYRQANLAQSQQDVESQHHINAIMQRGDITNLKLWLCMHPQPLSLRNDPLYIEEDVINNTSYHTVQTFKPREVDTDTIEDPTMLYEILQNMEATRI